MKSLDSKTDPLLHAYVDNELDTAERRHTLLQIETDPVVREQVCELQRTKDWVKFSFAGERAPTRTLPGNGRSRWRPAVNVAASIILLLSAFVAGWQGHNLRMQGQPAVAQAPGPQMQHVILQIGVADNVRFSALLARTEQILRDYTSKGIQVEVLANAGGLDMVRTVTSQHIEIIRRLIERYANVHFIACAKGLEMLQQQGQDARLIQGVSANEPAADYLIRRLTENWTLIQI